MALELRRVDGQLRGHLVDCFDLCRTDILLMALELRRVDGQWSGHLFNGS